MSVHTINPVILALLELLKWLRNSSFIFEIDKEPCDHLIARLKLYLS